MIDSLGDVIVLVSASIAAGSGLSAFRLLRRLHNLEKQVQSIGLAQAETKFNQKTIQRQIQSQAVFNSVIEDRLDELEDKPAPKQDKKMGTPRPQTARGLLYGRTRQGP